MMPVRLELVCHKNWYPRDQLCLIWSAHYKSSISWCRRTDRMCQWIAAGERHC